MRTPQRHLARDSGFPPNWARSSVPELETTADVAGPGSSNLWSYRRERICRCFMRRADLWFRAHKLVVNGVGRCVTGSVTIDRQVRLLDGDQW